MTSDEGADPADGQASGNVGPGLVANQTTNGEGADPVAGQASVDVGALPAADQTTNQEEAVPLVGPSSERMWKEASPPGLPLAKATAPPYKGWLPDIPKPGWEGGALKADPGDCDDDCGPGDCDDDCGPGDCDTGHCGAGGDLAAGQTMRVQVSEMSWRRR